MKVLDDAGFSTEGKVIGALIWAIDQDNVDIVNMSFRMNWRPCTYDEQDSQVLDWIDNDESRADFSSCGADLRLVAPGVGLAMINYTNGELSSCPGNACNGTSVAAPMVSGLAGLVKSIYPSSGWIGDWKTLLHTAKYLGAPREYGYGGIDMQGAARMARGEMSLRLDRDGPGSPTEIRITEPPESGETFDFVRGEVDNLVANGFRFIVDGSEFCLGESERGNSYRSDSDTPPSGVAYYYVARINRGDPPSGGRFGSFGGANGFNVDHFERNLGEGTAECVKDAPSSPPPP